MSESVPTRLLIQLCQASPETLAAVERVLAAVAAGDQQKVARASPPSGEAPVGAAENVGGKRGSRRTALTEDSALRTPYSPFPTENSVFRTPHSALNLFRWTGRDWKVVFAGGEPFYLLDTLGARYVDYLLHHPNVPIPAFDLEVAIQPEKGEVRCRNSIQLESDAQARRQYREALRELEGRRKTAEAGGDPQELESVDADIAAVKAAIEGASAPDTGKRARDNIRKAFAVVLDQLQKKGPEGSAFLQDLGAHLSIGLECMYSHPDAVVWD